MALKVNELNKRILEMNEALKALRPEEDPVRVQELKKELDRLLYSYYKTITGTGNNNYVFLQAG